MALAFPIKFPPSLPFGLSRIDNVDVATYQRAADRRMGVLAEGRVPGRRFPVRAASKRAASPSKAGVGPFQRN
jgi:hypothetical protein